MVIRPFIGEQKSDYNWTGPGSSVARVSASRNGRSQVRPRAATYQCRQNGTRSLGTQTDGSTQCQDNVTGCCIMLSAWGMILQWASTIKVSIELPVANRHSRDMTEKLLKATLNPNKQQQQDYNW